MYSKEELTYVINAVGIKRDIDLRDISVAWMLSSRKLGCANAIEMSRSIGSIQYPKDNVQTLSVKDIKEKYPKYAPILDVIVKVMSIPDGSYERLEFTLRNSNISKSVDELILEVPDTPEPNVYARALYYINALEGDKYESKAK